MIQPSLLEYSIPQLKVLFESVQTNTDKFITLAQQDKLTFHLDFVLKRFAQARGNLMSIEPKSFFPLLEEFFGGQQLRLTIHFMGEVEDLLHVYSYLDNYQWNSNWEYTIFVPEKYRDNWAEDFTQDNVQVGVWYDLGEWQEAEFEDDIDYLLMTVVAGKSGQKATDEDKSHTLRIAQDNPESRFIVDGGWKLEENNDMDNLGIVSYSSFWNQFRS